MKVLLSIKDIVVLILQDIRNGSVDVRDVVYDDILLHSNVIKGMNFHCSILVDFDVEDKVHLLAHNL